jgi:hypothetical protein
MSEHLQHTIDDLKTKRATLDDVIDKLEWFQREFPRTAAAVTQKKATKTGTDQGPRQLVARGRRDDEKRSAILETLRRHGGVMKPRDLAKALKLSLTVLRYQVQPLEAEKRVIVTGRTAGRLINLPGAKPAKEVP